MWIAPPEPPPAHGAERAAAPGAAPKASPPVPAASQPPAKRAKAAAVAALESPQEPVQASASSTQPPAKRAKAVAAAPSPSPPPALLPTAAAVEGLKALVEGVDEAVYAAAVRWCRDNNVQKAALIAELKAEEDLIAALPMNPCGLGANALRVRIARMRQRSMSG